MWSTSVVAVLLCVMIGSALCAVNMHSADTDFTIKPDGKLGTATISVVRCAKAALNVKSMRRPSIRID